MNLKAGEGQQGQGPLPDSHQPSFLDRGIHRRPASEDRKAHAENYENSHYCSKALHNYICYFFSSPDRRRWLRTRLPFSGATLVTCPGKLDQTVNLFQCIFWILFGIRFVQRCRSHVESRPSYSSSQLQYPIQFRTCQATQNHPLILSALYLEEFSFRIVVQIQSAKQRENKGPVTNAYSI